MNDFESSDSMKRIEDYANACRVSGVDFEPQVVTLDECFAVDRFCGYRFDWLNHPRWDGVPLKVHVIKGAIL